MDDEPGVRNVAKLMLEMSGFEVLTAADGIEAMEIYQRNPDAIALVVLDLSMPHKSGEEVFREMQALRPNVRVIVSSGYTEEHVRVQFGANGPAGFIQKPYVTSVLVNAVQTALK